MAQVKFHKFVAALPAELEADAIYYVRSGDGYDQYVTNGSGMIVGYPANAALRAAELNPSGLPTIRPSLRLDFLNYGDRLDPRITFTRSTGGGRFNAQRKYEWLPADQPRIDYDPVTGECLGLLVEEQRTNLLTYSSDFANAAWVKVGIATTTSAEIAPDGSTAYKLTQDLSTGEHHVFMNLPSPANTELWASVYLKAGEAKMAQLRTLLFSGQSRRTELTIDLETGAYTLSGDGGEAGLVEYAGNGWWRVSALTARNAGSESSRPSICVLRDDGTRSFTGDGTSGIYVWGAQFEEGDCPSSYIPTTNAQVTRAADNPIITNVNTAPWYNPAEGTFVVEAETYGPLTVPANDRRHLFQLSTGGDDGLYAYLMQGGLSLVTRATGGAILTHPAIGGDHAKAKAAVSFDGQTLRYAIDGQVASATAPLNVAALGTLFIGSQDGTRFLNGRLKSLRYYPRTFAEAELQAVTV